MIGQVKLDSWFLGILLAIIINLLVTGVFAFSGFALPTQKLLPRWYYHIYQPETLKTLCKAIKVNLYRDFLLATFWRSSEMRRQYFDGTSQGMSALVIHSKKSEFGHLFPFIILSVMCVYWMYSGNLHIAIPCILINLFFNFYPIILQRHHRMRIQKIAKRYQ